MDPTSTAEQFKRWSQGSEDFFKKFQALEQENKSLKLKIVELETKEKIGNDDEEIKNLKLKIIELTQELEKKTHEKRRMSGSVMSMSSGSADSQLDEVQVKEEHVDKFIQENLHTETPSMEEDGEIDIKEEDVGYGQSVVPLNTDQSSDTAVKHEIDRSIQRMFRSPDKVSNIESVSGHFGPVVGTDSEHNRSSSFHLTKELICSKSVEPEQQVPSQGSCEQKKKQPLTTRPTEKIQCEKCSSAFDTRYKLMKHNEDGKCKAPFNCPHCGNSFATERVFTNHLKTHTGEKKKQFISVQIDKELRVNRKRSSTLENEKVNSEALPEKKRKVVCETEVRNDEEMPRVRDGINPASVVEVERNPLKIKEFLERILSNLGKKDLLNVRLVSRVWNDESLEILRKSNFTQVLRDWKIERFILFATPNEPRPFILPFHLDFSIRSSSVYLARYKRILTSHVDSLCKMFGPQCVSAFTLTTDDSDWTEENIKEIGLIECLKSISQGLQTLDLTRFNIRIDFLRNQMVSFPNLKKLICNTSKSGRGGRGHTYISIIENSPDLDDLTLTHSCDLDSWPLKFNQLTSLSLCSMFNPKNILDKMLSISVPPVLRELRIGLSTGWSTEQTILVHDILKSFSSTLRSLTFHGHSLAENIGSLRFHKLPELEHLGLEYRIGNTNRLQAGSIGFSPENFPSLKSIELPIGFIFKPSPVQSEDDGVSIEFSSLNELILRVSSFPGPDKVNGPLEQLQKIFPTPSKLCLVKVGVEVNGFVKYILYRIMKSNWSKSVQQIEMIGFGRDDLRGILDQMDFSFFPQVGLGLWYLTLKDSVKTKFQNTMKRMRMEFEVTFDPPDSIILRRANSLDCQLNK